MAPAFKSGKYFVEMRDQAAPELLLGLLGMLQSAPMMGHSVRAVSQCCCS